MAQIDPEPATLEQRCGAAVDRLLSRHTWQLLDRKQFVQRTAELVRGGITTDPQRAAIGVYSLALYTACSRAEGDLRWNQGYTELTRYLYEHARHHYPYINPEDATQAALVRICTEIARCRKPIAFLAFALQHLMNAVRTLRRQEDPRLQPFTNPDAEGDDPLEARLVDPQPDPAAQVITGERRSELNRLAVEFMNVYPRAAKQFKAMWLKHVEGLDDPTISQRLKVPIRSLSVLRSRAKRKLRTDPRWRALAIECGILPDAS